MYFNPTWAKWVLVKRFKNIICVENECQKKFKNV